MVFAQVAAIISNPVVARALVLLRMVFDCAGAGPLVRRFLVGLYEVSGYQGAGPGDAVAPLGAVLHSPAGDGVAQFMDHQLQLFLRLNGGRKNASGMAAILNLTFGAPVSAVQSAVIR